MADIIGTVNYPQTHRLLLLCHAFVSPHQRDVFRYYRSDSAAVVEAGNDLCTALATLANGASHDWEHINGDALELLGQLMALYLQSAICTYSNTVNAEHFPESRPSLTETAMEDHLQSIALA